MNATARDRHNPPTQPDVSRRTLLGGGVVLGTALLMGSGQGRVLARPVSRLHRADGPARNVIFLVTDGCSQGTLTLADQFCRQHFGRESHWVQLMRRPGARRGLMATSSADSITPDSAAAGSAWGIGRKVNNGQINRLPDGTLPEPILVTARRSGKSTGLVTTTRVTHATPASFVANVDARGDEATIARQMLERGVDVMLGGGGRLFPDALVSEFPDVCVVRRASELASAPESGRLLGLFHADSLPFVPDRGPDHPTLPQMTEVALERLSRNPDGFVLQVEGARVDHAAHANDAVSLVRDQLEFDEAVAAALRFAGGRDDTLVIVTTDHGNANPGMTLYRENARSGLQRLAQVGHGFEWVEAQLRAVGSDSDAALDRLLAVLTEVYGYTPTEADRDALGRAVRRQPVIPFRGSAGLQGVLASVLANHFGISFMSGNHTSDHVECTVWGPGADALPPVLENTELHGLMLAATGMVVR